MRKPEDIGPIAREQLLNVYDFILMFHKKSCHGCNTIMFSRCRERVHREQMGQETEI